jgi:hypothetical protein
MMPERCRGTRRGGALPGKVLAPGARASGADLFQERGLEVTVIGVRLANSRVGVPVVAKIAGANL